MWRSLQDGDGDPLTRHEQDLQPTPAGPKITIITKEEDQRNIKRLQTALNRFAGVAKFPRLGVDGIVGGNTAAAVNKVGWWLLNNYKVAGVVVASQMTAAAPGVYSGGRQDFPMIHSRAVTWATFLNKAASEVLKPIAPPSILAQTPVNVGPPPSTGVMDMQIAGLPLPLVLLGGAALIYLKHKKGRRR